MHVITSASVFDLTCPDGPRSPVMSYLRGLHRVDITHAERQKEIDANLAARQHELDVLVRERAVRTQDLDFLGWLERPAPLSILFWDRPSIRVGLTSGKGSDVAFTESFFFVRLDLAR